MVQDILQEIPDEDLILLKNRYEEHKLEVPQVYGVISSCIVWKEKASGPINFKVFSVTGDDYLKSGTFIFIWEYTSCNLFAFTLEKHCTTLHRGLSQTKRIKWNEKRIWFLVPHACISTAMDVTEKLVLPHCKRFDAAMWILEKEEALKFDVEIPDDTFVQKLNKTHATLISNHWPHKHIGSEEYLSTFIENNESYGIFLKHSATLICWVLRNHFGLLCNLQTLSGYGGKGYGTLVTKIMAKELAEKGNTLIGSIIIKGNTQSEKMFGKLGFRKHQDCMFIESL